MPRLTLIILDGFGINTTTKEENAIALADTPTFEALFNSPYASLDASGKAVGVPDGQMGNSEI
jgi:2,3-bisphosphoglycerate-independent phosphoglycerate mutase